jgi:hypothetical protein
MGFIRATVCGPYQVGGLLALLAMLLGSAWAQMPRPVPLPNNATYGELTAFRYPDAQFDKKRLRLSPGARIYDTGNLIITPNRVPRQAKVLYRLDTEGQIAQMWLLTPQEAKQRAKSAKP